MHDRYPSSAETVRTKTGARSILALTGVVVTAIGSNISFAGAATSQTLSHNQIERIGKLRGSNPIELARASNKAEVILLNEIREKKVPASVLNGALELHGNTTLYLGPTAKGQRVKYDTSPAGNEFIIYYPLIVREGKTTWAAAFDNHHSQANVGQGSAYGSIAWVPLNEVKYSVYQNTSNDAPMLMKFHEVYDAHPEGEGVPPNPVYNIVVDGTSSQLPNSDAVMDTEIWPATQAHSNLREASFKLLSPSEARSLLIN